MRRAIRAKIGPGVPLPAPNTSNPPLTVLKLGLLVESAAEIIQIDRRRRRVSIRARSRCFLKCSSLGGWQLTALPPSLTTLLSTSLPTETPLT